MAGNGINPKFPLVPLSSLLEGLVPFYWRGESRPYWLASVNRYTKLLTLRFFLALPGKPGWLLGVGREYTELEILGNFLQKYLLKLMEKIKLPSRNGAP